MKLRSNCLGMFRTMVALVSGQSAKTPPNKYLGSASRFLLPCLLAVAYCLVPNAASAEGQCPPGMFETGSRDYIACAPIPGYGQSGYDEGGYDSGPSSQGPSSPQYAESSMATAVHLDTSAVWATAGHRSPEAAKTRVMDACAAAMGEGCIYTESWTGDVIIAVAIDGAGEPWPEGAATKAEAEEQALATCERRAGPWGCKITFSFRNVLIPAAADRESEYSKDYFPKGPIKRHQWVLVAWPDTPPAVQWQRKSWIISGRQNSAAAKKELLARCTADSGVACSIRLGVSNGTVAHFTNKRGQTNWTNATGTARALDRVEAACPADEKPCRVIALYDAATPRLQVIADPEPTRGYVSVAWPTKAGWNRLAIVTGRPTAAAANKDAIALCESQSKVTCELYLDNPDNRNSMFLGLYSLPEDRLHIVFGFSVEDVKKRAAEASAKNGVAYTNRVFVDLHERSESTPLYKD